MARKQTLPVEQLDRLNERYRRERNALVALSNARVAVGKAEDQVAAAGSVLAEARRREHDAYQDVVALVGAAGAAELCGGAPNAKTSRRRSTRSTQKQPAASSSADSGDAAASLAGE